jgi:murein DD-endopeptidase MepM/ murein hydrolase activator NlpD
MRTNFRHLVLLALAGMAACAPYRPPASPFPSTPAPPPAATPAPPPAPAKPAWVARPVVPDAVDVLSQTYIVRPGDTLRGISERTGAASEAIARVNHIAPPFIIRIGETLRIPGGRWHKVKQGETGIAIARAYGVGWDRIVDANELTEPYILRDGQKLLLPSRAEVASMTLEQRASAFDLDIDDLITGGEPAATETARPTPAPAGIPSAKPLIAPASFDGRFAWPLQGTILSRFGAKPDGRYNDGINIKAAAGTPVRAAADGTVAYAGNELRGFGELILLKHGGNLVTAYAHAEALLVSRGQTVKRGDIIARVGQTGSVDEPQLHFEIREGRKPLDPIRQLPPTG